MNDLNEDFEINIKKTEDVDYSVRDYSVMLNTGMSGSAETVTDLLNCCLKALIVDISKPVSLKIVFDNLPGIVLFEQRIINGQKYIPLMTEAIAPDGDKLNFLGGSFLLNNRLRITVNGDFNSVANIILRF